MIIIIIIIIVRALMLSLLCVRSYLIYVIQREREREMTNVCEHRVCVYREDGESLRP